jgi:hypothetical protein|tara:strand:+ start:515 stop:1012 length:498 start_codon:yes stop_codon:yes gene_type:complete
MTDLLHTKTQYPEEFEKFWKAYPRRTGSNPKNQAYRAWRKAIKVVTPERLRSTLPGYFAALNGKVGTEYVLMAATYLNQNRYEEFLVDQTADKKETLPPKLPDCSRKKDLYNKVGGDTYNLWLSGCQILGNTIVVSSKLKADWIKNHYGKELWQLGFDGITTKSV